MQTMTTHQRGPLAAGAILIFIGIAVLLARQTTIAVDWLTWPTIVGIAIFIVAVLIGGSAGTGFAALGGIVTMVGVVLAANREIGSSASWVYAWALVAPGGVGLGLCLYGLLTGQLQTAKAGFGALVAGIALFLVFFMLFEGVGGLNGAIDQETVAVVVPAAILGLGILLVIAAFVGPLLGPSGSGSMGWAPDAAGSSNPASGASNPAAGSSTAVAAGAPAATTARNQTESRSIDLAGATAADVTLSFGAGDLTIVGPAATGKLLDGTFRGGVRREDGGPGTVKLSTPADRIWSAPWDRPPFEWNIGLTAEVPLRLSIESGAARTNAVLTELRITELRVRTGASDTSISLPRAAGETRVDAQGGAAALRFRVPDGVAIRIRSQMALGSIDIDELRFPRDPAGGWVSPGYATAANRIELGLQGGLGSISVR